VTTSGVALVVIADVASRRALARALSPGLAVHAAEDADSARSVLAAHTVDVAVADAALVPVLLREAAFAEERAVIIAVAPSGADAARALGDGAASAIPLPIDAAWALAAARRGAALAQAARRRRVAEDELRARGAEDEIVLVSPAMRALDRALRRGASAQGNALVLGEPGSGVSLVARRLHALGPFAERPLLELAADAFTEDDGRDLIAALDDPVRAVVLDGVEALPRPAQDALLVLLEARARTRRRAAPRLIATAHPSIRDAVAGGTFRRDLLSALSTVLLEVPPLRRRLEDVPILAQAMLARATRRLGRPEVRRLGTEAVRALRKEMWPGNVRELADAIERAVLEASGDVILPSHLPSARGPRSAEARREAAELSDVAPFELLDLPHAAAKERAIAAFDRAYAEAMLRRTGGNTSQAARAAGMDRSNFKRLLRRSRRVSAAPATVRAGADPESK
jgi:DNA-binding NtrC family response regulator